MSKQQQDPYLDAGVRGYIINECRRNYWTVASWYEFEDFVQDAYMVYAKCRSNFRGEGRPLEECRRMMMGYFKVAFHNHVTDIRQDPRSCQQEVGLHQFTEEQEREIVGTLGAPDFSDVGVAELLARAPAEIVDMVKRILVDGVTEVPYLKTQFTTGKGRRKRTHTLRETTSKHIDRCLGRPGAAARLREYLTSA